MFPPSEVVIYFKGQFNELDVCFSSDKHLTVTIEGDIEAAKTMEDASLELGTS